MSEASAVPLVAPRRPGMGLGKAILASLPMLLLTALMLLGARGGVPSNAGEAGPLLVTFFGVNLLFFLMMKTGKTDRYRSILFVTMAVTFVISFISNLLEMRGSMSISEADMLRGKTPFCHMVIPMTLVPANQARVAARSPRVLGLGRTYKLEGERVIRVRLRRE